MSKVEHGIDAKKMAVVAGVLTASAFAYSRRQEIGNFINEKSGPLRTRASEVLDSIRENMSEDWEKEARMRNQQSNPITESSPSTARSEAIWGDAD
jgi:hypothetical protein